MRSSRPDIWYPDDAPLARNDALTITAILIQVGMLAFRLESGRELWVIILFHITGTAMELFKTDVGSWAYEAEGFLRIGGVPLFSGFMYAAVGSYMVRVYRLHDLRFARCPKVWATTLVAVAVYANSFTHHFFVDARWILIAVIALLWWRTTMYFRVWKVTLRAPQLLVFAGVAAFIWIAENIATWAGAWLYPPRSPGPPRSATSGRFARLFCTASRANRPLVGAGCWVLGAGVLGCWGAGALGCWALGCWGIAQLGLVADR